MPERTEPAKITDARAKLTALQERASTDESARLELVRFIRDEAPFPLSVVPFSLLPESGKGTKLTKRPIGTYKEFQARQITDDELAWKLAHLREKYDRDDWGIMLILGAPAFGNVHALDFERFADYRQWAYNIRQTELRGILAQCAIELTPGHLDDGPGVHLYFRVPDNLVLPKERLAYDPPVAKERPRPLIELLGQGSLICISGSPASCHQNGNRVWANVSGDLFSLPTLTKDQIELLLSAARELTKWTTQAKEKTTNQSVSAPGANASRNWQDWEDGNPKTILSLLRELAIDFRRVGNEYKAPCVLCPSVFGEYPTKLVIKADGSKILCLCKRHSVSAQIRELQRLHGRQLDVDPVQPLRPVSQCQSIPRRVEPDTHSTHMLLSHMVKRLRAQVTPEDTEESISACERLLSAMEGSNQSPVERRELRERIRVYRQRNLPIDPVLEFMASLWPPFDIKAGERVSLPKYFRLCSGRRRYGMPFKKASIQADFMRENKAAIHHQIDRADRLSRILVMSWLQEYFALPRIRAKIIESHNEWNDPPRILARRFFHYSKTLRRSGWTEAASHYETWARGLYRRADSIAKASAQSKSVAAIEVDSFVSRAVADLESDGDWRQWGEASFYLEARAYQWLSKVIDHPNRNVRNRALITLGFLKPLIDDQDLIAAQQIVILTQ